jgi:hypothetical protein
MPPKKLQKDSRFSELDIDSDGTVSDTERLAVEALQKYEKQDAQRRMAWTAMIAMLIFTALVFLPIFPDSRVKALGDLFSLFYIGLSGVVGAYFGASAFIAAKK